MKSRCPPGALLALALSALACGGSSDDRVPTTSSDSGVQDVGPPACTCIDLSSIIRPSNESLCGCPPIEYGCEDDPKVFRGGCDIAPTCWTTRVDPETGCPMPAYEAGGGCPCTGFGNPDAGP